MISKIFTIALICLFITSNVFASTESGLQKVYDELTYALTVEWDQRDTTFYAEQVEIFESNLRKLEQEGLTLNNYLSFIKAQSKDKRMLRDMLSAFNEISLDGMTRAQFETYTKEILSKNYSEGASWNGDAIIGLTMGAIVLLGIAYFVYDAKRNWPCYDPEIGDYRKCREMYPEN